MGDARLFETAVPGVEVDRLRAETGMARPGRAMGRYRHVRVGGRFDGLFRVEQQEHALAAGEEDVASLDFRDALEAHHLAIEALGGVEVGDIERRLQYAVRSQHGPAQAPMACFSATR